MAKRFNRGGGVGGAMAMPPIDLDGPEVSHQEVYHNPPSWLPRVTPFVLAGLNYETIPARVHVPHV